MSETDRRDAGTDQPEIDGVHDMIREAYGAALEDRWDDCEDALLEALSGARKRKEESR